jgi:hypothetical protein
MIILFACRYDVVGFSGFVLKIAVIAEASRRLEMMAEDGKHLIADIRDPSPSAC